MKNKERKRGWGRGSSGRVPECKALSSNPSTAKKGGKKKWFWKLEF
jgi:hypothetical protein